MKVEKDTPWFSPKVAEALKEYMRAGFMGWLKEIEQEKRLVRQAKDAQRGLK